jgi:hypothetical protein
LGGLLSLEKMRSKKGSIDLQSPTINETSAFDDVSHEETIDLSSDQLGQLRTQERLRLTSTPDVSPNRSSTPTRLTSTGCQKFIQINSYPLTHSPGTPRPPNAITYQPEYENDQSAINSCSQMIECHSNPSPSHTQSEIERGSAGIDWATSGIAQDILTRASGNLSKNVECAQANYPAGIETLSPTLSSSTTSMEADSCVVSTSGQFPRVD